MLHAFELTSAQRIRRRADFERAYSKGTRVHGRFLTVFLVPNQGAVTRLGVAATRKLGSAVTRNRAKRLVRELFRQHTSLTGFDIVVVPRRELLDAPFASLETDYRTALERRGQLRPPRRHSGV